jgi:regulator of sirC expression with transglutaminase-like and TPR domain
VMTSNRVTAIIDLLEDPSPDVKSLMAGQLKKFSMKELAELHEKVSEINLELAFRVEVLIQEKTYEAFIEELERLINRGDSDLETLVLFLARFIDQDIEEKSMVDSLDELALECQKYIDEKADISSGMAFAEFLGKICRFRGNDESYYAVGNSSIDCVLASRKGLPITLSVLYILVGRRLNIPVKGIALPGHFVVGVFEEENTTFLDPFNRGNELTVIECEAMTRKAGYPFFANYLEPVDEKLIFPRMLNNLKFVFKREEKDDEEGVVEQFLKIWTEKVFKQVK